MPTRSQGSARPDHNPTRDRNDTVRHSGDLGSYTNVGVCADGADVVCDPAVLDRVLYDNSAPFVGITAANAGCVTTRDFAAAQQWLAEPGDEVVTVAGTLRRQVLAADVDPADMGATAEAGQAAAEELVTRAETLGLPWLLRASGREGGRHVLVVGDVDEDDWRRWCHGAAAHHGVGVQPRRTLRLLAAPHRLGLAAPVLAGTLAPSDLPEPSPRGRSRRRREPARAAQRHRPRTPACVRAAADSSAPAADRSRREYGDALARARAGWGAYRTYAAVAVPGSKAVEQGESNWRRWVWSRVVTVVAAEWGCSEGAAWAQFEQASRRRARELGRDAWRRTYWGPAVEDAGQERPRRRRLEAAEVGAADEAAEDDAEVERVRTGLHAAVAQAMTVAPRRPQFRRSTAAAVDALAPMVVRRAGSLAERAWAEIAHLSRSTLRAVLTWLLNHGILRRARTYAGGTADCTRWALGPASAAALPPAETRPTGGTPPPQPPTLGRADRARLRRLHARERQTREENLSALTDTSVPPESNAAAHRAARSLAWQRRWWTSLEGDEQQARRTARRAVLSAMHRSRLSAWLSWLSQRHDLVISAERLLRGRAKTDDHHSLAAAPPTVHRGLHAPLWNPATPPAPPELELAA